MMMQIINNGPVKGVSRIEGGTEYNASAVIQVKIANGSDNSKENPSVWLCDQCE